MCCHSYNQAIPPIFSGTRHKLNIENMIEFVNWNFFKAICILSVSIGAFAAELPLPSQLEDGDQFGSFVCGYERWLFVSAIGTEGSYNSFGRVYIYHLDSNGSFQQQGTGLVPSNPDANSKFGSSIAARGNWLAIGDPGVGKVHILSLIHI